MNRELSLCSCCICAKSENLVQIYAEDHNTRQLLLKIEFCLRMTIPVYDKNWSISICCTCMFRLEVCYQFMIDHVKGQNALHNRKINNMITMQLDLNWTSQDLKEDKTCKKINVNDPKLLQSSTENKFTISEMSSKCSVHPKDCNCEHCCVLRHGNLPLLVEVIEKSSNDKSQEAHSVNSESTPQTKQESKVSGSRRSKCSCEFCGKEFNHKGDMNKHRRKHTGERPYSCDTCNQTFSHASNLLRHQKMHSGIKQFLCPVCEKGFYRKDKLSAHFKTVHAVVTASPESPKMDTENSMSSSSD